MPETDIKIVKEFFNNTVYWEIIFKDENEVAITPDSNTPKLEFYDYSGNLVYTGTLTGTGNGSYTSLIAHSSANGFTAESNYRVIANATYNLKPITYEYILQLVIAKP